MLSVTNVIIMSLKQMLLEQMPTLQQTILSEQMSLELMSLV